MTRALRIAHVQPMTLDLFGHEDRDFGTEASYFLSNLAIAQAQLGHRPTVHLLTSTRPSVLALDGVDVHFHSCLQLPRSLDRRRRFARQVSFELARAIRREDTDIIHFHGLRNSHLMLAVVAWRASAQAVPLVAQDQGLRLAGLLESKARRYALGRVNMALAANPESARELVGEGVAPESLRVVPNGYDPEIFYPGAPIRRGPGERLHVLVVSRLSPEKDPLTMAEGVRMLAERGCEVSLTVVGQGPLRAATERLLDRCGASVEFVDRHLPQATLADFYRSANVLVLTSPREGSNQAVLEAMACGLPVVATGVPGIQDVVGGAGTLVPAREPRALARALETVAGQPRLLERQRELGLARAAGLTWHAIAKRLEDIYTLCLQGGRR